LDEHELQSAMRNLNDTLRKSQMMKNRQSEEIAQIMDALENESEDETESNSKDENVRYQPDYDNSFDLSQSLEGVIGEVTG
jgi:predicted transcriptional regulator